MRPKPNSGTYTFYGGSALILAIVTVVAAIHGNVLAALIFGVITAAAIGYLERLRRRSSQPTPDN